MKSPKSINVIQEYRIELSKLDKREIYETLIDLAQSSTTLDQSKRIPEYKIRGCISDVYIVVETDQNNLSIKGYADSLIIQGYIAMISDILNGSAQNEYHSKNLPAIKELFRELQLDQSIIPSRAHALHNILEYITERI